MINKLTILIFHLLFFTLFSQEIKILDSIDSKEIPYVEICSKDNYYFTDSVGTFNLPNKISYPIQLRKLGYKNKTLQHYYPVISLSPIYKEIKEVKIEKKKEIEFKNNKRKNKFYLRKNIMFGFMLNGLKGKEGVLKRLSLPCGNTTKNISKIKLDFFPIVNGKIINEPINQEDIIVDSRDLIKNNVIDLSDYSINFKDTILVGVTIIENPLTYLYFKEETSTYLFLSKTKGSFYSRNLNNEWHLFFDNYAIVVDYKISY